MPHTNKLDHIHNQIEELRKTLYKLSEEKLLTDPLIIETSEKLDDLINQYNEILQKRIKKNHDV